MTRNGEVNWLIFLRLLVDEYIYILFVMSTTVHLPPNLLDSVDHRAKELGVSRNRYVIRALEQALETETRWSQRFVAELEAAESDEEGGEALEELRAVVAANRTSKAPPRL